MTISPSIESNDSLSETPQKLAEQFCSTLGVDDGAVKDALSQLIKKAMSDAIVSSKQELMQQVLSSDQCSTHFIELIEKAIPTFGSNGIEFSNKVFGA